MLTIQRSKLRLRKEGWKLTKERNPQKTKRSFSSRIRRRHSRERQSISRSGKSHPTRYQPGEATDSYSDRSRLARSSSNWSAGITSAFTLQTRPIFPVRLQPILKKRV